MKDHGGDWAGFQREYGRPPLDFSANVSPLGVPDGVRRAAEAALSGLERYPDPLCRELREKLAADHGVSAGWILCGSGAADLIYRLAAAERPRTALVTAPTFSEYENALTLWGCRVTRLPLSPEENFALPESILSAVTPQAAPQTAACCSAFWSAAPPAAHCWRWTNASMIFWTIRPPTRCWTNSPTVKTC